MTDDEAISRAREIYCDDDIEIDDFDVKPQKQMREYGSRRGFGCLQTKWKRMSYPKVVTNNRTQQRG